ncbi:hypothetical protein [Legionella jamestowniensis]|uniref:Uncharacterized protein n=1 Tax=Legionella jamestowniensis TaxID=455 RepID=A0A0W0UJB2_9GAMM|nr:hypothetical protein [Legionella jamestowniensis]KTD07909.1 hypothetical protein Ljam_2104 [Legionella jamestowniensis]OCH99039.1 hypothetical protein A8135_09865 [Legionella jamestowniensis]SFL63989.1 hypothetical protein SAMN02746073_1229 [Legionella jamestowniensis DSM 19215]
MFFASPKINRISKHLETTLAEICQDRWAYYLTVVGSAATIQYRDHLQTPVDKEAIFNTYAIFREKEHFSWRIPVDDMNEIYYYKVRNAQKQYEFYSGLLRKARLINNELQKKDPDCKLVINTAREIERSKMTVPSVFGGDPIELNVGMSLGGNIFIDFFAGFGGLIYAPIMGFVGLLCITPYCLGYSGYCGSPTFFLDTASYLCSSAFQAMRSIVFPAAMMYSAYTTNSYNPFTKGEVKRSVEGIISLVEDLQKQSELCELTV